MLPGASCVRGGPHPCCWWKGCDFGGNDASGVGASLGRNSWKATQDLIEETKTNSHGKNGRNMGRSGYFSWLKNLMPEIMRIWFFQKTRMGSRIHQKRGENPWNHAVISTRKCTGCLLQWAWAWRGPKEGRFSRWKNITDSCGAKVGCGFDGWLGLLWLWSHSRWFRMSKSHTLGTVFQKQPNRFALRNHQTSDWQNFSGVIHQFSAAFCFHMGGDLWHLLVVSLPWLPVFLPQSFGLVILPIRGRLYKSRTFGTRNMVFIQQVLYGKVSRRWWSGPLGGPPFCFCSWLILEKPK